jgi:hypothetical protein
MSFHGPIAEQAKESTFNFLVGMLRVTGLSMRAGLAGHTPMLRAEPSDNAALTIDLLEDKS